MAGTVRIPERRSGASPRQSSALADFEISPAPKGHPPLLLRMVAFGVFFFPSSMVLGGLGAAGTVPLLLSAGLFVLWVVSFLLGLHDPVGFRHPGRLALGALILASCLSYIGLVSGWTGGSTPVVRASADRWLILLAASAGIVLVTTEQIRTVTHALVLVRALLAGGVFCCLVAVVQFYFRVNPMEWIQAAMPGFTYNGGDTPFQARGALMRVSGSTFHSIELAVVTAMLLPLSIWRGLYDPVGRKWIHWGVTALLVFAVASTVSRSGVLGLTVGMLTFLPFLPRGARRWLSLILPVVLAGLFLTVPGLVSTISESVSVGESDPSISNRTNNYPLVAAMFEERPIFGTGPGNYVPQNAVFILDNQYLNTAVTLGLVGLLAVVLYLLLPGLAAVQAARVARTQSLKCLAGAIAAAGLVAGVCSLGFDSLSFPVFALVYPLFVGLGGAVWILVKRETKVLAVVDVAAPPDSLPKNGPTARNGDN
ncbi:O-antigen ligase family protein [Arthrobacter sp. AL08]|uniref:O-antigen ligase family protein n=1 Tax=unclassified Arthrobacter TaxID=235627 RepID=UPI00249C2F59|nr:MULTISPECIES: O-antigen ligase family protein [unclassified Arthrobacter]MDI3242031.1 O-antigen ligase family protein [Arthrobacter sp. AL05]MDI3278029.1 O-antigen ligase family protein [Arthrobacter sp. AL08]